MLLRRCMARALAVVGGSVGLLVTSLGASAAPAPTYEVVDLFEAAGVPSAAYAISASGIIVGSRPGTGGATHAFRLLTGAVLELNSVDDLGTLGGRDSTALGINIFCETVGSANTATGATHAFLRRRDKVMIDLGTLPGGTRSTAFGINDLGAVGQVVGSSDMTGGQTHAFGWSSTLGMFDLGTLGGTFSTAAAINDAGQIAGSATNFAGLRHAFLRRGFT